MADILKQKQYEIEYYNIIKQALERKYPIITKQPSELGLQESEVDSKIANAVALLKGGVDADHDTLKELADAIVANQGGVTEAVVDTKIAAAINALKDGVSEDYDTLKELADGLNQTLTEQEVKDLINAELNPPPIPNLTTINLTSDSFINFITVDNNEQIILVDRTTGSVELRAKDSDITVAKDGVSLSNAIYHDFYTDNQNVIYTINDDKVAEIYTYDSNSFTKTSTNNGLVGELGPGDHITSVVKVGNTMYANNPDVDDYVFKYPVNGTSFNGNISYGIGAIGRVSSMTTYDDKLIYKTSGYDTNDNSGVIIINNDIRQKLISVSDENNNSDFTDVKMWAGNGMLSIMSMGSTTQSRVFVYTIDNANNYTLNKIKEYTLPDGSLGRDIVHDNDYLYITTRDKKLLRVKIVE